MDVYEHRRLNLKQLAAEVTPAELARRSKIAASTLTRYQYEPGRKGAKNISEENARKLEAAARKPMYWLDAQHPRRGVSIDPVAQAVSQRESESNLPQQVPWEGIVNAELPSLFWVLMPDDSMAPDIRKNDRLTFDSGRQPSAGQRVLVVDANGGAYVRRYKPGAAGRWRAVPDNDAEFDAIESERDGLRILAVMVGWARGDQ